MTLPSSLYAYLQTKTAVTGLIGNRFYFVRAEQSATQPFVVFRFKDEDRDYAMDGPAEMYMADCEMTIEAAAYFDGHEIYKQLSLALDGFRGVMGDIIVTSILFVSAKDDGHDDKQGLYKLLTEISVWYKHSS